MTDLFADRLVDAIQRKGSPICVGIDPIFEMLPDAIAGESAKRDANDSEAAIDAIFAFTTAVLKIVAPYVPCVKFQSACFENAQTFEFESLKGRVLSSSYIPNKGDARYEEMLGDLARVFDRHAVDGTVRFDYDTRVYYGTLS